VVSSTEIKVVVYMTKGKGQRRRRRDKKKRSWEGVVRNTTF
jgi:tmRNA-binding protein